MKKNKRRSNKRKSGQHEFIKRPSVLDGFASMGIAEAVAVAKKRYPSHDFNLVASVAAQLAPHGKPVSLEAAEEIAESALNLLDGILIALQHRKERRNGVATVESKKLRLPAHLAWAEGKLSILGTDRGGSDAKFDDLLKAKIRCDKLARLCEQRRKSHQAEPTLSDVAATTPSELNELRSRLEKNGFTGDELVSLNGLCKQWRRETDGRRRKNNKRKKVL